MSADPFVQFKSAQKEGWSLFAPLEALTIQPAGLLVEFAEVKPRQRVLDVACGTGVTTITSARKGAHVTGLDLCPALLERAHRNKQLSGFDIDFLEGDVESLPFKDGEFDVVMSQFGHMFAPRPSVAIGEMLRVLKPGGTIAFSTWPPDFFTGKLFLLVSKYLPPPDGVESPAKWGDPSIIKERLGSRVKDIRFQPEVLISPMLSLNHVLHSFEKTLAPNVKLVEMYQESDPEKLEAFREEARKLVTQFTQRNALIQHFLMTRAIKN